MFAKQTHNIFSLSAGNTYSEAEKYYKTIEPIRNSHPEIRPFSSNRRERGVTITKSGESYQINYNRNPVITVHPDNSIELCAHGWVTESTRKVVNRVVGSCGIYFYLYDNKVWVSVHTQEANEITQKYYPLHPSRSYRLVPMGIQTQVYKLDDASMEKLLPSNMRKLDKAAARKLNKDFKALRNYIVGIFKLTAVSVEQTGFLYNSDTRKWEHRNYTVKKAIMPSHSIDDNRYNVYATNNKELASLVQSIRGQAEPDPEVMLQITKGIYNHTGLIEIGVVTQVFRNYMYKTYRGKISVPVPYSYNGLEKSSFRY